MPVLLKETRSQGSSNMQIKKKFLVTLGCVIYVEWLGWGGQKWCLLCSASIKLTSFYQEDFRNTPGIKKNRMGGWPVLGLRRVFNWRSPIFRLPCLLEKSGRSRKITWFLSHGQRARVILWERGTGGSPRPGKAGRREWYLCIWPCLHWLFSVWISSNDTEIIQNKCSQDGDTALEKR